MSTRITEMPRMNGPNVCITSFYGGRKLGRCISIRRTFGPVNFSEEELQQFFKILKEHGFKLE